MAEAVRSVAQGEASRANGACSRGPVSPEGKAKVARNARRHGLCSSDFRIDDAGERAEFEALLAELMTLHNAVDGPQREACRHLAWATWRRRVCDRLEAVVVDAIDRGEACAEAGGDGLPSLRTLVRYRGRIDRDLREARAEIEGLKAVRAAHFARRMRVAKEFKERKHFNELMEFLGPDAFAAFRADVAPGMNEPGDEEQEGPRNRKERRRAEALGRKGG